MSWKPLSRASNLGSKGVEPFFFFTHGGSFSAKEKKRPDCLHNGFTNPFFLLFFDFIMFFLFNFFRKSQQRKTRLILDPWIFDTPRAPRRKAREELLPRVWTSQRWEFFGVFRKRCPHLPVPYGSSYLIYWQLGA